MEIPGLLSYLAFGSVDAHVQGINQFPRENWPPLIITFVSFHSMTALGFFFIVVMGLAAYRLIRGKLYDDRWLLKVLVWSVPLPILAIQLGWITAEVGRQPWIVYKLLRTSRGRFSHRFGSGDRLLADALRRYLHCSFRRLAFRHDPEGEGGAGSSEGLEGRSNMDLNTILFSLIGVLAVGYAILDGFDLGVGMLSLLARSREERDLHVAAIGPVWDGNEVWLLATADVLFGAFPLVFTTVFSGFYLAFMLLLVALVARAVAIEFRLLQLVISLDPLLGLGIRSGQPRFGPSPRPGCRQPGARRAHRAGLCLEGKLSRAPQSLCHPDRDRLLHPLGHARRRLPVDEDRG